MKLKDVLADSDTDLYFDEKGKFIPERLGQEIMQIADFVTMRDTGEVYCYDKSGIYQPTGEVFIREAVTEILGEKANRHYGDEVVYYIRTKTGRDREELIVPLNIIPLDNGVFNIETGEMENYSPSLFFTSKHPVHYDPDAKCPSIDKFLSEIVATDEEVILLKEAVAYCFYRSYLIQKSFMLIGEGGNGKSVYLALTKSMLGAHNTTSVNLQDLETNRFASSYLYERHANKYPDISANALYGTGKFKMLTGGDQIAAERKFGHSFNFVNYAKLLFSCNIMPITHDDTGAFYRRWVIVKFPFSFEDRGDPNLLGRLTTASELSGFFNELVPILKDLLERGAFSYHKTAEEIKEEYTRLSDTVGSFALDRIEISTEEYISKDDLYNSYCDFCRTEKLISVAKSEFSKRLPRYVNVEDYRPKVDNRQIRSWKGIRLKENSQDSQGSQDVSHLKYTEKITIENKVEKTLTMATTLTTKEGICTLCKKPSVIVGNRMLEDGVLKKQVKFELCAECFDDSNQKRE